MKPLQPLFISLLLIFFTGCSSISYQETWQPTPIEINNQATAIHSEQAPEVEQFLDYKPLAVSHYQLENGLTIVHYQSNSLLTDTSFSGLFIQNSEPYNPIKLKLNVAWNQIIYRDEEKRTSVLAANLGTEIQTLSNSISTGWYILSLKEEQQEALELLSRLLKNRFYSEQELSWQKQQYVLKQQFKSISGSSQSSKLYRRLVLSKDNIVARQTKKSSTRKQLNKLKLNELENYFLNHFIAENMLLVIISPTPLDDLRDQINQLFSNVNSRGHTSQNRQSRTQLVYPVSGLYAIDRPHSTQVDIRISFAPLQLQQNELATIKLFATILAGRNLNSRMQSDLRENKGLSYSIYYQLESISDFYALHFLSSTESHKAPALIQGMQQHIDYLLQHGLPKDEFEQVKQRMLMTIQRRRQNPYNKMSFMVSNFMQGNSLQQVSSEATVLRQLNYAQFDQFLQRLKQQPRLIILSGDEDAIAHHLCKQQSCNIHWYSSSLKPK